MLVAGPPPREPPRASASDKGPVGGGESLRDRARGAGNKSRIHRRRFTNQRLDLLGREDERGRRRNRAGSRAMWRIVEQNAFATRFTDAERDEPNGPSLVTFLDGDRA